MLSSFDYGKSLQKQLEAFKRLTPARQQARLPVFHRQLETYANNYLYNVLTHPSVKPGLLKGGAETLVEASRVLQSTSSAYRVFAELAARSRKVEAVPGLAHIVDKLLELPAEQKKERAALLSWRIVAGNLQTPRLISYLADRAHLTNSSSDWRDYASGVAAMIRKGELQASDESLVDVLNDLISNKESLGDMVITAQRDLAEAMIQRRSFRQAETLLVSAAVEARELSPQFVSTVEKLIESRPETCWELHQVLIAPLMTRFGKGETQWRDLQPLLERSSQHTEQLARYLVERPELLDSPPLAAFAAKMVRALPADQVPTVSEKVRVVLARSASTPTEEGFSATAAAPPRSAESDNEQQPERQPVPEPQLAQLPEDSTDAGSRLPSLPEVRTPEQLEAVLEEATGRENTAGRLSELAQLLNAAHLPAWASLHGRLWLAHHGADIDRGAAIEILSALEQEAERAVRHPEPERALRLLREAAGALSAGENGLLASLLASIALGMGNSLVALELAEQLPPASVERDEILAAIEVKVSQGGDESADNLIALAEAQRFRGDEPSAGLQSATRAALLSPTNEPLQERYLSWVDTLPGDLIQRTRAAQAVYLCARERNVALLPVAITELDALLSEVGEASAETAGWLLQLAPLLVEAGPSTQVEVLVNYGRLYSRAVGKGAGAVDLPDGWSQAFANLGPAQAEAVIEGLRDLLTDSDQLKVECMLHLKRGDWRSAVPLVGAAYDELEDQVVPVQLIGLIFKQLSDDDMPAAAKKLLEVLHDREDPDAAMEVVRRLELKLEAAPSSVNQSEIKQLMQSALARMAELDYEPAARFIKERTPRDGKRFDSTERTGTALRTENGLVGEMLDLLLKHLTEVDNSGRRL
jgi:hypothetical protein